MFEFVIIPQDLVTQKGRLCIAIAGNDLSAPPCIIYCTSEPITFNQISRNIMQTLRSQIQKVQNFKLTNFPITRHGSIVQLFQNQKIYDVRYIVVLQMETMLRHLSIFCHDAQFEPAQSRRTYFVFYASNFAQLWFLRNKNSNILNFARGRGGPGKYSNYLL